MPKYSLDKVTIDGFRGLRKLRLDDLGLFNILVGANNSGKTSVLEALSILCNPLQPFEWVSMVRRRDFGQLDETRVQSLRWCFTQSGQLTDPDSIFEGECIMGCDGIFPLRQLRIAYKDILGEPATDFRGDYRHNTIKIIGSKKYYIRDKKPQRKLIDTEPSRGGQVTHFIDWEDSDPEREVASDPPIVFSIWEELPTIAKLPGSGRRLIPTETLTPYSYQLNTLQVRRHTRRIFDHERDLVLDLVRTFDSEVMDIELASFRGVRPAIYLKHRRLGPAPLSVFGDGLRRAVLLAGTLPALKGGGILLLDEIETGIHVSALQRVTAWLIKAARELGVQIVATTHSLEAVDAIALSIQDQIDDLVTFRLDQTEQETRAKRIYGDLLLRLRRDRGLDVR